MPITSSLRSQRLASLRPDIGDQYVAFRLRLAWFVLPIKSIYRVIPIQRHIPKLTFAGQGVPVVDVGKLLFGQIRINIDQVPQLVVNGAAVSAKPSLVVVRGHDLSDMSGGAEERLLGVLSNSQPALQRLMPSQLVKVPPTYSQTWKVNFIESMTLPSINCPPLFVLNVERLMQSAIADG
jgi:chemotaxis signal transduction protein